MPPTRDRAVRARGPVLVCCALGYSRSACAVAAWLLATGRAATVDAALARVRAARSAGRAGRSPRGRAARRPRAMTAMTLTESIDEALAWRLRLTPDALAAAARSTR